MYKIDCSWLAQHCEHDVEHVRTCIAVIKLGYQIFIGTNHKIPCLGLIGLPSVMELRFWTA